MSKTVIEYVWGELLRDGEIAYKNVKLKLTVRVEDSIPSQIVREVVNHELARIGVLKDGEFTLRYVFDGKQRNVPFVCKAESWCA